MHGLGNRAVTVRRLSREERCALYKGVYDNNQWGRSPSGRRFYSDSPPALTEPLLRAALCTAVDVC